MSILYEVRCPHCSQRNRIRDGVAPVHVKCGRCGGRLRDAMVAHELRDLAAAKGTDVETLLREAMKVSR